MNLLPVNLSTSLRGEIGPVKSYEELVNKLKRKPENLLKFILQAYGNRNYLNVHRVFITSVWIEITNYSLSQMLPWNSVAETYALYWKYGEERFTITDDLKVHEDRSVIYYSRIVFMQQCAALRKRWMVSPEEKEVPFKIFCSKLTSFRELSILYQILIAKDYALLAKCTLEEVILFILQTKEWGCDFVNEDLQNDFCDKIVGYQLPLSVLQTAQKYNLSIVEKKCLSLLDNALFYKDDVPGIFHHFTLHVQDQSIHKEFNEDDIRLLNSDIFLNFERLEKKWLPLRLEWFTFIVDGGSALICYKNVEKREDILKICNKLRNPQLMLVKKSIKRLIFNESYKLKIITIIGMILYFDQVEELNFSEYKFICDDFIPLISNIRENLKHLNFSRCHLKEINFLHLKNIKNIELLTFIEEKITPGNLECLMGIVNLRNINFIQCSIDLPEYFTNSTWDINELTLKGITTLSSSDMNRLFALCHKLKILNCEECSEIKLMEYPYPTVLEELTLSFEQFEKEISPDGTLPAIDRFASLKKLSLVGKCSDILKPVILRYLSKLKISIRAV